MNHANKKLICSSRFHFLFAHSMKPISLCLVAFNTSYSHSAPSLYALKRATEKKIPNINITIVEELLSVPFSDVMSILTAQPHDMFVFSCYLWSAQIIARILPLLKQIFPQTHVIWGGPDVSGRGKKLLQENILLDFIIDGEGENALPLLLKKIVSQMNIELHEISGLVYRDANGCIQKNNSTRLMAEEIESILPFTQEQLSEKGIVYWETSRGCPFTCSFCVSGKTKMIYRPIEVLRQELLFLAESTRPLVIKLLDRSFSLAKNRLLLLDLFLHSPKNLRFHIEANPDYLDEDFFCMLDKFPRSRLQFELGLQTFHDEVLKSVRRKMNAEKAWQNCQRLVAMGFSVHVDLIAGLPLQDLAGLKKDIDKTFLLFSEHLQLGTLKILPASEIENEQQEKKILADAVAPYEVFVTAWMSHSDLKIARDYAKLLDRLYNSSLLRYSLFYLSQQKGITHFLQLLANEQKFVKRMWQRHELFSQVSGLLLAWQKDDSTLPQILLFDYLCNFVPSRNAPAFVQDTWLAHKPLSADALAECQNRYGDLADKNFCKKSFPLFYFSSQAADFFKSLPFVEKGFITQTGNYFCLRQSEDKKGIPLMLKETR